ncbi:tetratricopeptide repeat-containing sulfotransferase family protein [Nitrospirillum sp. BR 11163]|uniref:tetratricopeptide repeat-containing sulfotransferase family protein n=1 Tax=Nitrospirillum sp. BR 11163 TaxID=3104323 RepID=UPI002AFFE5F3|nr:sulfotransferase [Nitrospirillum sp. BR 11163]MEA1672058.1 sulfotransferase [Nitrospirillum sp. BR 11163]
MTGAAPSPAPSSLATVDAALDHAAMLADTNPSLALAQVAEVLRAAPDHPRARLIEGRSLRLAGDAQAATDVLRRLVAAEPRSAAAAMELGLSLRDLGQLRDALDHLRHAVAANPNLAAAWRALADTLNLSGDHEEAEKAHLAGVKASTRDPILAQAAVALLEGRLNVAERALRDRLRAQPTDVAAIRMMAELAVRLGRYDDAIKLLSRALHLAPAFTAAREMLARTLQRHNRPAEALAEVERLLAAEPDNPSVLMLKASLLVRIGEQDAAATVYAHVLARHPQQAKGWMSYGHVLKAIGRVDEAIAAYRTALEQQPTLGEAWWSLANLKTFRFSADDRAAMERGLLATMDDENRLHLHFALGKALEDAGDDDAATFRAYAEGNRLRRAQLTYDPDETHDQCARIAAMVDGGFLARTHGGCPAPDPIFIVGLPRSGSTLVEQILASHSMVEGTSELPDMMAIAARLAAPGKDAARNTPPGRYPECLGDLAPAALEALGAEYLARTRVHRHDGKPFFIDKMPNNWMHVALIRAILPQARIVDVRRHPLGVGWSAYKQHFARGQGFTYDLAELGRYYADYATLMAHVDRAAPGAVHRVIYERLVADTESEVRALLDHLGLPFEDGCLAFWDNRRTVRTPSSEQVRQPIFTEGLDHWRRFEPWLAPLKAALGTVLQTYPEVEL